MPQGPPPFAQCEGGADGLRHVRFGSMGRLGQIEPPGQESGQGGGKGASAAVGVAGPPARGLQEGEAPTVVEKVGADGIGSVSPFDDHRCRAECVDLHCGFADPPLRIKRQAGERFRFGDIRGDDQGQLEQVGSQRLDSGGVDQEVSGAADHHGIDDQILDFPALELAGDGAHDVGRRQHSGFGGVDSNVLRNCFDLERHVLGGNVGDAGDSDGVLGGDRCDGAHAVNFQGRESLQIGLDAGAAAAVGARRRQNPRDSFHEGNYTAARETLRVIRENPPDGGGLKKELFSDSIPIPIANAALARDKLPTR